MKAIEETIKHVGRLWIAEYLLALTESRRIAELGFDAEVLALLVDGSRVLLGDWLGVIGRLLERFERAGEATTIEGLARLNPGPDSDAATPLGQLLRFRNNFAHGSFLARADEVREHVAILHEVLASAPGLVRQPALVRDDDGGWRAATGAWPVVDAMSIPAAARGADPGEPVIAGPRGRVLSLYPLLTVATNARGRKLVPIATGLVRAAVARRPALIVAMDRYGRERDGFVAQPPRPLSREIEPAVFGSLADAVARDGLVLVDLPPGISAAALLAAISPAGEGPLAREAFAAAAWVLLRPDDLSRSGLTVARALLRLVERALGEPEGSRPSSVRTLTADLRTGLEALSAAKRRVLFGLGDLHFGTTPHPTGGPTARAVWELLAGQPVTAVATAWPGTLPRAVFDRRLTIDLPSTVDEADVLAAAAYLTATHPLRARVLALLLETREPLDLFAVCDRIEAGGTEAFEPAVERALWDLAPLLRVERSSRPGHELVRIWSASASIRAALRTGSFECAGTA